MLTLIIVPYIQDNVNLNVHNIQNNTYLHLILDL